MITIKIFNLVAQKVERKNMETKMYTQLPL